jgi:nucleoside-diphosphate-sugar epimerase
MRFVIAGMGWLGLPLAKHLAKAGHACIALSSQNDLPVPAIKWDDAYPHHADVLISLLPPLIKQQRTDMHTRVVSFAQKNGIKRLIYTSSTSIYTQQSLQLTELNADPNSEQASIEAIYKHFGNGAHMIRLGGLMGPGRNPGRFYAGRAVPDPDGPVNFVHLTDVINAIEHLTIRCHQLQGDYNVVSPMHPNRMSFFTAFANHLGETLPFAGENLGRSNKIVSSAKLIQTGFLFRYNNPLDAVNAC